VATVLVVVAMIAGLSVARMVTDPEWAFTRPEISDVRVARLRRPLGSVIPRGMVHVTRVKDALVFGLSSLGPTQDGTRAAAGRLGRPPAPTGPVGRDRPVAGRSYVRRLLPVGTETTRNEPATNHTWGRTFPRWRPPTPRSPGLSRYDDESWSTDHACEVPRRPRTVGGREGRQALSAGRFPPSSRLVGTGGPRAASVSSGGRSLNVDRPCEQQRGGVRSSRGPGSAVASLVMSMNRRLEAPSLFMNRVRRQLLRGTGDHASSAEVAIRPTPVINAPVT
jgi:hypothetical protein